MDIKTLEDVLNSFDGNISKTADYTGLSNLTVRKNRDLGTLGSIIIINGSVYKHMHDLPSLRSAEDIIQSSYPGWEVCDPCTTTLTTFDGIKQRDDRKIIYKNGKCIYLRKIK